MRSRAWCFTHNNPVDGDLERICEQASRYMIIGFEKAPTTGTEHFQGYVYYDNAKTFDVVKKLFPDTTHIEKAKGTPQQNYEYCKKGQHYQEFGERPCQGLACYERVEEAMQDPRNNFHTFHQYRRAYYDLIDSMLVVGPRTIYYCDLRLWYDVMARYNPNEVCHHVEYYDGERVCFSDVDYFTCKAEWLPWYRGYPSKKRVGYRMFYVNPEIVVIRISERSPRDHAKIIRELKNIYPDIRDAILQAQEEDEKAYLQDEENE